MAFIDTVTGNREVAGDTLPTMSTLDGTPPCGSLGRRDDRTR
jgi:hypothetical protein